MLRISDRWLHPTRGWSRCLPHRCLSDRLHRTARPRLLGEFLPHPIHYHPPPPLRRPERTRATLATCAAGSHSVSRHERCRLPPHSAQAKGARKKQTDRSTASQAVSQPVSHPARRAATQPSQPRTQSDARPLSHRRTHSPSHRPAPHSNHQPALSTRPFTIFTCLPTPPPSFVPKLIVQRLATEHCPPALLIRPPNPHTPAITFTHAPTPALTSTHACRLSPSSQLLLSSQLSPPSHTLSQYSILRLLHTPQPPSILLTNITPTAASGFQSDRLLRHIWDPRSSVRTRLQRASFLCHLHVRAFPASPVPSSPKCMALKHSCF